MSVEIWEKEKPRGKDIAAMVTTVLTMIFKVFIVAAVIIAFSWTGMAWWILSLVIIVGIAWALGVGNVVYLYMLFKGKIKK